MLSVSTLGFFLGIKKANLHVISFFQRRIKEDVMQSLPAPMLSVMGIFSPLFSYPTYQNLLLLTFGHILCKGRRTITEVLKQLGLKNVKNFSKYHDVFSKAKWPVLGASKLLFLKMTQLIKGKILLSIDSTIERRKGSKY